MLKKEVNLWMNQSLCIYGYTPKKCCNRSPSFPHTLTCFQLTSMINVWTWNAVRIFLHDPNLRQHHCNTVYSILKGPRTVYSVGVRWIRIFLAVSLLSVRSVVVRTMNEQMSQVNIIAKFELKHSPSALKPGLLVSGGTAHPRVVLGKTGLKKSWGYQVDRVNCVGARFGCKSFPCILSPCPKPLHTSVISLPVCTFTFLPRSKIYNEIRLACEVWCL